MRINSILAAVLIVTAGRAYAADFSALQGLNASDVSVSAPGPKAYIGGNNPPAHAPFIPIEWVAIGGGKFMMGSGYGHSLPVHPVAIKTFQMTRAAVTVAQYAECVVKGRCTEPGTDKYCNWRVAGRELHPVNCVDWNQANQYARFKGARLPSESEWEYAATSAGRYRWGYGPEPSCNEAVVWGYSNYGCGTGATMPVCSKPAGNTAQGLCDMVGNVAQWVQDNYQFSYEGAPVDGSAFEGGYFGRVTRGKPFYYLQVDERFRRTDDRGDVAPGNRSSGVGFRLARSR